MKKHLLFSAVALAAASFSMTAADNVYLNVGDEVTFGVNTYKVAGNNLVSNNSFDEGFTGWTDKNQAEITSANWEIVPEGGADGGAYLKSINGSGGSGDAASLITGLELEAGKTYYAFAYLKDNGAQTRFSLGSAYNVGTDNNKVFTGAATAEWTKFEGVFKTTEEMHYLNMVGAWLAKGASFDCIYVAELEFVRSTEVTFPVQLGVEYTITETHNNTLLSISDKALTVQEKGAADWTQKFIFEKAYDNENLYIKGANGKYITKAGNPWDPSLVDEAPEAAASLFNLVKNDDETYSIKVISSQFFGINAGDKFAAGSNIYFDKSGADDKCTFTLTPAFNFPVEIGVAYKLIDSKSGAYLSTKDNAITIQEADAEGFNQVFTFEIGHDFKNAYVKGEDGQFLAHKGIDGWTATTISDPAGNDNALISLEAGEGGSYGLKFLKSGVLGADKFEAGASLYTNKGGNSACWFQLVRADGKVELTALNNAIAEAEALLAATEEGTEAGQYSTEARAALTAAIAAAKAALEATTQDEVTAAVTALNAAISTYKAAKVPAAFELGTYNFQQAVITDAEVLLSTGWHANSWESGNNEQTGLFLNKDEKGYNQKFVVTAAPADAAGLGYNIATPEGEYLYNNNGKLYWNAETDPKTLDAIFTFDKAGDNYTITNAATGKFVGPNDNTKGWTWIHAGTNHQGGGDGHLFIATKLEADGINAIDAAVENAPVEYFNLQGVRVANPENGLYIRRQGIKVSKVYVK